MALRKRNKPLPLQKLDAVIPRLSPHFKRLDDLKKDAANRYKGYIGEQKVDYHLELLPNKYIILHDVCLEVNRKTFQIDSVVAAPNAIFLLEDKNYGGTVTFDTTLKQFTRNDGTTDSGYRYPITQAETAKLKLTNWLYERNFQGIPVYYLIPISDPGTIIKVIGDREAIAKVVMHAEYVPMKIMEIDEKLSLKGLSRLPGRKIGEAILRDCKDFDIDILRQYGIKAKDILPGVQCPGCGWLGMERMHAYWKCNRCNKLSKGAHLRALADYFLLINPWISNKECMHFLKINSRNLATRILKAANLKYIPEHKRWIRK